MHLDDCFELGHIVKPHGTKGEVQVYLDVDNPDRYRNMESVFLAMDQDLVPFFIESIKNVGKGIAVKFDDVDSVEQAEKLRSLKLYLPLDFLPKLGPDQFYYHEIIGFDVVDDKSGVLGKVKEVYLKGNQDLILMIYQNHEILIPVTNDIIKKVDKKNNQLFVILPDGLLDVYLT